MKACILGCGNQGSAFAGLLAQEEDVEELVLADRDISLAEQALTLVNSLALKVKAKSVRTEQADGSKSEEVARVARGADIVFNGILPSCNIPIMRACLDVGAHYMDLFSLALEGPGLPRSETVDAQLELDEKFKAAGLTAVPCLGCGPGWSNLVTRYIVDQLDTVDSVIARFVDYMDSTELLAPVTPSQMFSLWLGPPHPSYMENGEFKEMSLLDGEEEYQFPPPVGKQTIYNFAQDPSTALIHRFSGKPIRRIEQKMGVIMGGLGMKDVWMKAISEQTRKHAGTENMFELFGESLNPAKDFKKLHDEGILKDGANVGAIEVTGCKDGVPVRHTAYYLTTLSESIKHLPWATHGIYATIGGLAIEMALALGREEFTRRGVIFVADLENPESWLKKIAGRGHQLGEKIERGAGII